jgi:hypothetical protein
VWQQIEIPEQLGKDAGEVKWRQDQGRVELFLRIPANCPSKLVDVQLSKSDINVTMGGKIVLCGELLQDIKVSESHWFMGECSLPNHLNRLSLQVRILHNQASAWFKTS